MIRHMRGTTERCLVLGVGVLDGLKLGAFKAILAHEYGHFLNRDTAGGHVALSVRRSLLLAGIRLAQGRAARWYNPAWLFLVGFEKIFLRISQGASRLQEVMADRVAAFAYGPDAFERGLVHVIRRDIAFERHMTVSLREVVQGARPLTNLYSYEPENKPEAADLEEALTKALVREPSPYDSHPKPIDRVRWVRELSPSSAHANDESAAWDLFASRVELEQILTAEVRRRLANRGVSVAATIEQAPVAVKPIRDRIGEAP
jgi:Zn-dependent protease with chaperone function